MFVTYAFFKEGHMRKKQLELNLYKGSRGGRRPGCGRKRLKSKGVAHRTRETVKRQTPMHINFKYKTQIRNKDCLRLLKRAIVRARRFNLRIIHYSLQSNHIHLIVEADHNEILTAGMRSLTITFAKGLKQGKVQIERYHLHVLRTIQETRNAVHYVLFNKQRHEKGICSTVDEYSSILLLKNATELIRKFAMDKKMTLKIRQAETWDLDKPYSYFLKSVF